MVNTRVQRRLVATAIVALGVSSAAPSVGATTPTTEPPTAAPSGPFCASIPPDGAGSFEGMAADPVATAAASNPYLTTLASAIGAAGLVDTLNGPGPFTVFAPNNDAFAKVPPDELAATVADMAALTTLLTQHVVADQALSSAELLELGSITTIAGTEITFTAGADGEVIINGGQAMITCADVPTANATVQIIDTVLGATEMELPGSL